MIPVELKPEPHYFDTDVRIQGLHWLRENGIDPDQPPPKSAALPNFWSKSQKDLWDAYCGICAYLCIFFEWRSGMHSTDHFIPKSKNAGQAYEWANFRLSCLGMNRIKNRFDDMLDPFEIQQDTFFLNFASGRIYPNSALPFDIKEQAEKTICRLQLNESEICRMRAAHYEDYCRKEIAGSYLKRKSPFVWHEMQRQGLLHE